MISEEDILRHFSVNKQNQPAAFDFNTYDPTVQKSRTVAVVCGKEQVCKLNWIIEPELSLLFDVTFIIFIWVLSSLKLYKKFVDYLPSKRQQ